MRNYGKYHPAMPSIDWICVCSTFYSGRAPCRWPRWPRRRKLSTTTCWRRIQQLEQNGVIKARVALLDRNALGLDVTIFAHVKLATTGRDALAEFEAAIRDRAEVLECYTLTGEWDFLLKIVTKNIKAYEAFYLDYLSRIPCVRRSIHRSRSRSSRSRPRCRSGSSLLPGRAESSAAECRHVR